MEQLIIEESREESFVLDINDKIELPVSKNGTISKQKLIKSKSNF